MKCNFDSNSSTYEGKKISTVRTNVAQLHPLPYYISGKSLLGKADDESCFQEWKSCGVRTLEH